MNRVARFVWACIGTAAMQKGPLWWAGHHVNHHRFADRDGDPHSPTVSGVYYAHIGWFLNDAKHDRLEPTNPGRPRLLEVRRRSPGSSATSSCRRSLLAVAMYLIGGLPWLVWGFCLPTMTLAHATFAINTVNHMFGSRRFDTHRRVAQQRRSRRSSPSGEGWHNNHHRYQRAARNGFYWWEFDPTWYVIRAMAAVGLAWDVQAVPERIYDEARAAKAHRSTGRAPSIIDVVPLQLQLQLELAEEVE